VIPMPIPDFSIPPRPDLETAVDAALHRVRAGANVVVRRTAGARHHPYPLQRFGVLTQGRSPVR
jgi:hypothetical protein